LGHGPGDCCLGVLGVIVHAMRFDRIVKVEVGAVGVDPVVDPAGVPVNATANLPVRVSGQSEELCQRLLMALIAPAGETVSFEIWALVETGRVEESPVERVYVLFATVTGLAGSALTEITGPVPSGGPVYVRITDASSLTETRGLGIACAG